MSPKQAYLNWMIYSINLNPAIKVQATGEILRKLTNAVFEITH